MEKKRKKCEKLKNVILFHHFTLEIFNWGVFLPIIKSPKNSTTVPNSVNDTQNFMSIKYKAFMPYKLHPNIYYIQHKLYETILNIHDMLSPSLIAMSNDVILCNEIFIATNCLIMSMYSQNIDSKIVIIWSGGFQGRSGIMLWKLKQICLYVVRGFTSVFCENAF